MRALGDGSYTVSGPIYTGQRCCMGRSALLDMGRAQMVVTERTHEPWDLGVFHCMGVQPQRFRCLLLKDGLQNLLRKADTAVLDGLQGANHSDGSALARICLR